MIPDWAHTPPCTPTYEGLPIPYSGLLQSASSGLLLSLFSQDRSICHLCLAPVFKESNVLQFYKGMVSRFQGSLLPEVLPVRQHREPSGAWNPDAWIWVARSGIDTSTCRMVSGIHVQTDTIVPFHNLRLWQILAKASRGILHVSRGKIIAHSAPNSLIAQLCERQHESFEWSQGIERHKVTQGFAFAMHLVLQPASVNAMFPSLNFGMAVGSNKQKKWLYPISSSARTCLPLE